MRIRIIGPSGSGKTYLAQKLSRRISIPYYELDGIFWDNSVESFSVKRDPAQRDIMFRDITEHDDWIIEGVQHSWTQSSFSDADIIYLLNPPAYLCRIRIIRRFLKRKLTKTSRKNESLRSLIELLKWTKKFYAVNLPEIRAELEPYGDKTVEISSTRQLRKAIRAITD